MNLTIALPEPKSALLPKLLLGLLTLALSLLAPAAATQDIEIEKLADKLSTIIEKSPPNASGGRTVLVIDFAHDDGNVIPLSISLADRVSETLARKARGFVIIDRRKFRDYLEQQNLLPSSLQKPDPAANFALRLQADLFLLGSLSTKTDKVRLSVKVFRTLSGKEVGSVNSSIPYTQQLWEGVEKSTSSETYPMAGKNGYGQPTCAYCPFPPYSEAARAKRIQGSVILRVVITKEGRTDHIWVVRSLSPDLDNNAMGTIMQWRFKPVKGPDGKPAAVRTDIEITFRLL